MRILMSRLHLFHPLINRNLAISIKKEYAKREIRARIHMIFRSVKLILCVSIS